MNWKTRYELNKCQKTRIKSKFNQSPKKLKGSFVISVVFTEVKFRFFHDLCLYLFICLLGDCM